MRQTTTLFIFIVWSLSTIDSVESFLSSGSCSIGSAAGTTHRTFVRQNDRSSSYAAAFAATDVAQASDESSSGVRFCKARELVLELVNDKKCFTTEAGARAFGEACGPDVVYEDRFEPQPMIGKAEVVAHMLDKVQQRKGKGDVRLDKVSDGDAACGFAWTWTCGDEEGLRGTSYVELNDEGKIKYVQEIPEPIFKPGDMTKDLLEAITKDSEKKAPQPFDKKTPMSASELARYLFVDLQNADDDEGMNELMRFVDDNIFYRDFNFKEPMRSPAEVRKFVEEFSFPGIEFKPTRFDDGVLSTCFTWEVVLMDAPDTIKGISFYELDPETRKIVYVRDVPESAIKPPILGKLARQLRPGLGVFKGVPLGSRPGGM